MADDFDTAAELEIHIPDSELRSARAKIEQELGDVSVGVSAETATGGRQPRDPASGQFMSIEGVEQRLIEQTEAMKQMGEEDSREQRRRRREFRWARQRTEFAEVQVELLDEIKDGVEDGGIGSGGGGGGGTNIIPLGGAGAIVGGASSAVSLVGGALGTAIGGAASTALLAGAAPIGAAIATQFLIDAEVIPGPNEEGQFSNRTRDERLRDAKDERERREREELANRVRDAGTGGGVDTGLTPTDIEEAAIVGGALNEAKNRGTTLDTPQANLPSGAEIQNRILADRLREAGTGGGRDTGLSSADIEEIVSNVRNAQQPEVTVKHSPSTTVEVKPDLDKIERDVRKEVKREWEKDLDDLTSRIEKSIR